MEPCCVVASYFESIASILRAPAQQLRHASCAELGPDGLSRRAQQFTEDWGYGIDQLAEFSRSAVDALASIQQASEKADADLVAALRDAASH